MHICPNSAALIYDFGLKIQDGAFDWVALTLEVLLELKRSGTMHWLFTDSICQFLSDAAKESLEVRRNMFFKMSSRHVKSPFRNRLR